MTPMDNTFTPTEVARILKVSERTLARWRTANPPTGPAFVTIGASVRYPQSTLVEWVESNITMPEVSHG